jgi:hypothetical protein
MRLRGVRKVAQSTAAAPCIFGSGRKHFAHIRLDDGWRIFALPELCHMRTSSGKES